MPFEIDGSRVCYRSRELALGKGIVAVELLNLRVMRKYLERHRQSETFTRWAHMREQPELFQLLINTHFIDHRESRGGES